MVITEAIGSIGLRLDVQNISSSIFIITVALSIVDIFSTE
jgi:hypothetical protein